MRPVRVPVAHRAPIRRLGLLTDEEFDALTAAAGKQADRLVMGQLPVVPIAQFLTHSVASTRVRDLVVNSLGTFDASRVWLTPGPSPKRRG